MSQILSLLTLLAGVVAITSGESHDGVEIITYGEPCPRNREYSVELEVPVIRELPEKIVNPQAPCPVIKSYDINIEVPPPPPPVPAVKTYDTELEIVPEPEVPEVRESIQKPVKLLTGLTSRVDRIVIPACELSSRSSSPER